MCVLTKTTCGNSDILFSCLGFRVTLKGLKGPNAVPMNSIQPRMKSILKYWFIELPSFGQKEDVYESFFLKEVRKDTRWMYMNHSPQIKETCRLLGNMDKDRKENQKT